MSTWSTALLLAGLVFFVIVAACSPNRPSLATPTPASSMSKQMVMKQTEVGPPPVKGFYGGQEILFIHTEASDAKVADMLTAMMDSKVLLVPKLGGTPESLLADVFVFTNGVPGGGPFGFQPDVFDVAPSDEGYTPLRAVNLVTWKAGSSPRVLKSVEAVKEAASKGEIMTTRPGAVVNMPMLTWPGGQR